MIEEPPFRNRIADVLATLDARERHRKWAYIGGASVLGMIAVLGLTSIFYFAFVGEQNHLLELRIGPVTYRIESHTGPFTIALPDREAPLPIAAGNGGYLYDIVYNTQIIPRSYLWAPMAKTEEIVKLHRDETACHFLVNGIPFHASANRLRTEGRSRVGARQWLAEPGKVVVVDIDQLANEAERP